MSSAGQLLTTHNLSVGYLPEYPLFEALNLTIRKGELVCFMGPNGIGKSTLIRTLAGLQKALRGNFECNGPETLQPKSLAVVLTDKIRAANMTVLELIMYGRYPHVDWRIRMNDADRQAVEQAIEVTHISALINKRLFELSDGQMQMVMIARALAQDTPLLLLDEPTAHLDLNNRVEIMNLLRNLTRSTSKGIVLATHELDLALQTADVIWLAGKAKNILTGIPEDLVLNGSFDEIFQFKGFDLKTGKVFHEPWRRVSVQLVGEGHGYLWTKNALERSGYRIDPTSELKIAVENTARWQITFKNSRKEVHTIDELLDEMGVIC